ncbi:hypothetical protein HF313_26820 [Massilia atriviolacea]|uniref:Uncharacterized protein n=1 Tax=Massilia atriviolacea TaxID=2495579 RepID=A0A430HJ36_9BURK|nr:hypothetical protein [Massilia atriviolacea]RSZ57528.1 hypothetical protein EJB06_17670 [Massilia atriviolacea]
MKRTLVLSATLACLVACSTPYRTPVLDANPATLPAFSGVASLLRPERALDILLVHGMCTQDESWARTSVAQLVAGLGGDAAQVALSASPVGDTGIVLYKQSLPLAGGSVNINAILWSPLTRPLKAELCYDQSNKSGGCPADQAAINYPYERAALNRSLKDKLLDDCLADAVIYQGKAREAINQRMQAAILQAVGATSGVARAPEGGQTPPEPVPLVLITDSLGSKVTFDAIFRLAETPGVSTAALQVFNRIPLIFMRANQLPLLRLAEMDLDGGMAPPGPGDFPADPIQALVERSRMQGFGKPTDVPTVVAFTDPNDLLSYTLARSPFGARATYPIIDVVVSNAPTYLGLLELPTTAHTNYPRNTTVQRMIACGEPALEGCGN